MLFVARPTYWLRGLWLCLGCMALLLAAAVSVRAQTEREAHRVAESLESRYSRSRTLQVSFLERYRQGRNVIIESGTAYFSRPGRMRWEYESPESKLFLVDGTNAWFYVPADRTATRAKVKESGNWHTPLALLAGKTRRGLLKRMCGRLELLPAAANQVLRCLPKGNDSGFREILFEVDAEFRLQRILIHQPGDTETEFRFANWRENPSLPEVMFHFAAPPGVAIVDEQSIAGPGQ